MKASDPHKNDSIDIESYLDNGWIGIAYCQLDYNGDWLPRHYGIDYEGDKAMVVDSLLTWEYVVDNYMILVDNVLIEETFYTVYLLPPYDGME